LSDILLAHPGEVDETYSSSLILAHSLYYVKRWRHPQNQKYKTYCGAVRSWLSHDNGYHVQKIW